MEQDKNGLFWGEEASPPLKKEVEERRGKLQDGVEFDVLASRPDFLSRLGVLSDCSALELLSKLLLFLWLPQPHPIDFPRLPLFSTMIFSGLSFLWQEEEREENGRSKTSTSKIPPAEHIHLVWLHYRALGKGDALVRLCGDSLDSVGFGHSIPHSLT